MRLAPLSTKLLKQDDGEALMVSTIKLPKVASRFALSICVLLACAVLAGAQDAGQALRLFVGYNTLKNSTTMSAEKRAEVDRLGKLAQEASAAGRYGEAMKHYYHAMAIMRGQQWNYARALTASLTLQLERALLEPAQSLQLKLGQLFALDEKPTGKLSASILLVKAQDAPDAAPVATIKTLDSIEPDFAEHPFTTQLTVPNVEDGNYRIVVRLKPETGEPITKAVAVRIERGLQAKFVAAKVRAAKIEAKLKASGRESLLAVLPTVEYRISLFDLAAASQLSPDRIKFDQELKEANAMLDELESGRDPLAARRGDFRKAYRSKVDNTLQPYRIFVPSSYDGSKPFPLIVALHGMGGDENSYFDLYANGAFKLEAEQRGYIVVCPKGRQPASMYLGAAEQDVMDVIAEVRRDYRIDPDRIYMTGHSMGGFGTWSIAMNHPDLFAAIAPVAGGGDPSSMAKIAHIPQLVIHGDDDKTVSVERSRQMVAAAKRVGAEVRYLEIPKGDHITVAARTFKDVFDWFDSHRRKGAAESPQPARKQTYLRKASSFLLAPN
jgi:predicted esterase